jgi:Tfp pilus assembly protein PilF
MAAAFLGLVSYILYSGSLRNAFVFDDEFQVLQNPFVRNPHLWWRIFTGSVWSFQGAAFPTNYYRPLHIFSHWLIYRLAGPNPAAFHLFQVLIYAVTVALAFFVACELLGSSVAALVGVLLWTLHPLHVESVVWIAAVPDTGFAFFYLLAFWLFLRAEKAADRKLARHGLAALAFLPSLFFKEMALSFPLLILAYWFYLPSEPGTANWRSRIIRWSPYIAATAAYLAVRISVLGFFSQAPQVWRISPRIAAAAIALLGGHTHNFFWPAHLTVFRTFELGPSLHSPWPWLALVAIGGAIGLRPREPEPGFLILWWVIGLLPTLDIRQLSFPLLADRSSYLPSLGLCLSISFLFLVWLPRKLVKPALARTALAGLALLMCLWAAQTVRAIPHWHDNASLLDYSFKQSPNAALLHLVRAFVLQYQVNDFDGAAREYETAMRLNRASLRPLALVTYDSNIGLGQIARQKGRVTEAVSYFQRAIRILPMDSPAYDALGAVYFPWGDYSKSAEYFSQAVGSNPYDLEARFYLGTCQFKLGKYHEAARQFHAAREIDPTFYEAFEAEARALEAAGNAVAAAQVRSLKPSPQ